MNQKDKTNHFLFGFTAMSLIAAMFEDEEQRCQKIGSTMSGIAVGVLSKCVCVSVWITKCDCNCLIKKIGINHVL